MGKAFSRIFGAIISVIWAFLERIHRFAGRVINRRGSELYPERKYLVELIDETIIYRHPDGKVESISLKDLQKVLIRTNDLGPCLPDVFWIFRTEYNECAIPQGASGEDALLDWLTGKLPEFDSKSFCAAMTSIDNADFVIWESKS